MSPTLGNTRREARIEDEILEGVEWTAQEIAEVERFRLTAERGGYDQESVDLLVDHAVACMRAGRQIADPTGFALPKRRLRTGYSAADTNRLLDLLQRRREEWSTSPVTQEPEPVEAPAGASGRPTAYIWTQAQVDWVRDKRFASKRGGYNQSDVDDFLDQVIIAMAHGQRLPDVTSALFDQSGFKQGYDFEEVDAFLDELSSLEPGRR